MSSEASPTRKSPASLIVFNARLRSMFEAGVPLMSALASLTDIPEPAASCIAPITDKVCMGATLSSALAEHPDVFPPFYTSLVRAGEAGGVLEVILARADSLLALLTDALGDPADESVSWDALPALSRNGALLAFTEAVSVMLGSGVPILQTLETAAELLPAQAALAVRAGMIAAIKAGERATDGVRPYAVFPEFWLTLFDYGEIAGTLDTTLHTAAVALEAERRAGLSAST